MKRDHDRTEDRPASLRRRLADLRSQLAQASTLRFDYHRAAALAEESRLLNNAAARLRRYDVPDPEGWAAWRETVALFWDAFAAAWPPGFQADLSRLRAGDAGAVDAAISFLEADPWFFRSGYAKEEIIAYLNRLPLTEAQAERLRRVVLAAVDGRDRREFRRYCRLARKVDSPALRSELAGRLECAEPAVRRHARWVLEALK